MTSPRTRCVQATAGRPHGRSIQASLVPTLFLEYLRRINNTNIRIKVTVEDVPWRLGSARSVFKINAGDRAVKLTKTAFNKEHHTLLLWYS